MGDFEVTVETLRRVVDRHGKVHDELSATNERSQVLAQVQPPMRDPATTAFTEAACQAAQAHLDSAASTERELRTRIEELKASVDQYATTEQENVRKMTGGS